jgi:UDP-2-acetamido-2,6-beta-L-arabino-hexul-4-ose reductase
VATFADAVAHDRAPTITRDREVPLLHAQAAAEALVQGVVSGETGRLAPAGDPSASAASSDMLQAMHDLYRTGEVPPLTTRLEVDLFNTYRACRFPEMFPIAPQVHDDERGALFETVRAHGGTGQPSSAPRCPAPGEATITTCTRSKGSLS